MRGGRREEGVDLDREVDERGAAHPAVAHFRDALDADDDAALFEAFLDKLNALLRARNGETEGGEMGGGATPRAELFNEYNEALVNLSDDHLRETYINFMLIYTGEEDDETLTKLGIELSDDEDVDEATVGFCEMMSIKIGELIDQPRHVRVAAHAAAKQKKADAEKARLEKIEKDKATHKAMAAMKTVTSRIYQANEPMWRLLANGEGDASESRRFARKPELKLLVMDVAKMKMISTYNWQNMSTGALKMT